MSDKSPQGRFLVILGESNTKTGEFVKQNLDDLGIESRFANSTDQLYQLNGQVLTHLIVLNSVWYQLLHAEAHQTVYWAPAPPLDLSPSVPPALLIVHLGDDHWDPPWESRHFNLYGNASDGPTFQKHVLAFLKTD